MRTLRLAAGASIALAALPALPALPAAAQVPVSPGAAAFSPDVPVVPDITLPAKNLAAGTRATIKWARCPDADSVEQARLKGLECGRVRVPLDYRDPAGRQITLALTRARHTRARHYRGAVLLNRGGPGAHGRDMPARFARPKGAAAARIAATYDWIGFDPRGVGASRPALVCAADYQNPAGLKPETLPRTPADERAWRARAASAAADCGSEHADLLPHMSTLNSARDLEEIRKALGLRRIGYLGYSYGSYLGSVYATLFPGRVRRMVLDSVVRPSRVWYQANLDQDVAFEKRIRAFFRWIAGHHARYRLGRTATAVRRAYYSARSRLGAHPIAGRVGPVELDDIFLTDGYQNDVWPDHAKALSDYLRRGNPAGLRAARQSPSFLERNNYAVYLAVECRDAAWPRDWAVWHRDNWALHRAGHRFETWNNAWYNAPCAYWPVVGGPAPRVRGARAGGSPRGPAVLLVQARRDAATPYAGALEMHRRFPGSRLVVTSGGDHGVTLHGDRCVDRHVWAYLGAGRLPANRPGPDARCRAPRAPAPSAAGSRRA